MSPAAPETTDPVDRALAHLDAHPDEHVSLEDLAAAVGIGATALQRRFVARIGMSPRELQAMGRLARFRTVAREGGDVADATYAAGYGSSRVALAWSVEACAIGLVLVGTTERGVAAVLLGDDEDALEAELRAELPRAELARADGPTHAWTAAVLAHLDDVRAPLGAPLDLRGTPFQLRVWRALRDIPAGERRSYSEVAAATRRMRPCARWSSTARASRCGSRSCPIRRRARARCSCASARAACAGRTCTSSTAS